MKIKKKEIFLKIEKMIKNENVEKIKKIGIIVKIEKER